MPIYQYECGSCHHSFEGLYKYEEDVPCNACGAMTTKVPTSAQFKIRGFRAANGYGGKFIDTPGVDQYTGRETGHSFSNDRGADIDHNATNTER